MSSLPGKIEAHYCAGCSKTTYARVLDEGTVPFLVLCRHGCGEIARAVHHDPLLFPNYEITHEWYRQTRAEARRLERKWPGSFGHWKKGGLALRKVKDGDA